MMPTPLSRALAEASRLEAARPDPDPCDDLVEHDNGFWADYRAAEEPPHVPWAGGDTFWALVLCIVAVLVVTHIWSVNRGPVAPWRHLRMGD